MIKFLKCIVLTLIAVILLIQIWIFTSLFWWRTHPVETTMFMRTYYYTTTEPHLYHEWRDYNQINDHFKHAVVAAEDGRFLQHHGFDWDGMLNAAQRNTQKGEVVAGGSTISQQLAKNLFLFNQRSYIRKAQEAVATFMMERMWSKQRILEVYMNSVELGDGIYGVEAASRRYFGKSAKNLSKDQAIKLAAMLPNPKYYQKHPEDSRYKFRQRFIQKYIRYSHIPANE
ncbi:monofunctional biosynthetic peptidoglycan transglycosylase [Acinetobacter qingfengensis]|uniref:Biosynthetic peptidoglycan transglycosylase n=1 Tax=Acinetobacter qingfengensis TaxID=1262585 RepID=A0A1E7R9B2_9GAMM|nr:monofunctional biosynthetic peptidoglycan transglycosylase [Acinetobacter qingfengensis]KAA8735436.1 monofunctional biosynthetic peptidoglycan transglycosylase [Acinetobacter qingfengensis]OEY95918.1 monofunctional biosynthetic peptidoglycan transglycosylase [Acinetobacter qingfengensis]